jgi:hypothetical protein
MATTPPVQGVLLEQTSGAGRCAPEGSSRSLIAPAWLRLGLRWVSSVARGVRQGSDE